MGRVIKGWANRSPTQETTMHLLKFTTHATLLLAVLLTGCSSATPPSVPQVTDKTVVLAPTAFTVPAGKEVYMCQDFANPFGGQDADVDAVVSEAGPGIHHILAFYLPGATDAPLTTCSGLLSGPVPYGTQNQHDTLTFPPGVALKMPAANGFRLQMHYLNATAAPIVAQPSITFHLAAAGTVTQHAGLMVTPDLDINVAPHSSATVFDDCTIPQAMTIGRVEGHAHQHLTDFAATLAGQNIYSSTVWSEPEPKDFPGAGLAFKVGDLLHFACSYSNMSGVPVTFGPSAQTDEMCVLSATYWPVIDESNDGTITAKGCVPGQN